MRQEGLWQVQWSCAWQPGLNVVSHTNLHLRLSQCTESEQSACGVQVQSVVAAEADGDWSLLSAASHCKVLTRSPVVPLYSKNITIKTKPAGLFGFFSSSRGSQAANSFLLAVFTSPGIQKPNWIFSALPLHASNIFYSWCNEDCNYRRTGVCSWSTGSIALVKAIRKQHSKTQNLNSTSSVLGKQAPKIPH